MSKHSSQAPVSGRTVATSTSLQRAAAVMGALFLIIGVLGFVPGVTSNSGSLALAGNASGAMLLGHFQVSVLHNVVHLVFGAAGLVLARSSRTSYLYLMWGGALYLALFVYGMVVPMTSMANFMPINTKDNILHVALGALMLMLGVARSRQNLSAHKRT